MTDEQLARVIFCAVNDHDPVQNAPQIDAAFAGRRHCDGPWISARNARIAATAINAALATPNPPVDEPWPGYTADQDKRRVVTLAKLGLMLSVMAGGEAPEVTGFDAADLYADVLMALGIEEAEDVDIALQVARDDPEGHMLTDTPKPPVDEAKETLESIVTWGDETFGPCTAERAVSRGREELDEADLEAPGSPKHAVEIADTIICFLRVPGILEAINAKMAINRERQWNVGTDGTGYHVKPNLTGDGAGA